jgi:hypothetical protein
MRPSLALVLFWSTRPIRASDDFVLLRQSRSVKWIVLSMT